MTPIPPAPARPAARPRSLERLEAEIVTLATQLTAATARFLTLVAEFDTAEGWRDWGMRSTAHWLSWKCGISLHTGREQVRVARALGHLPLLAEAFAEGRLSYSKVRGVSRFATADTEADLVELASNATAAQIDALTASMRRTRTAEDTRRRHAARYLRWRYDDDGSLVGTFRLPPEVAATFLLGLDAVGDTVDADGCGNVPAGTLQSRVDALVALAEQAVAVKAGQRPTSAAERYQLILHATRETLAAGDDAVDGGIDGAELADGTRLHPATARRITCQCPHTTMTDGPDGAAIHVGRRHRRIRGRLLRAVQARDRGRCRAPGCTERATQIHHVRHWANGGVTCLLNLISLCDHHHWLVHEGGFTTVPRAPHDWALLSPAGVVVDPHPTPVADPPDLPVDPSLVPDAVSGGWDGSRLDVSAAIGALTRRPPRPSSSPVPRPPADPIARDDARPVFDWDTLSRWLDGVAEMHLRGLRSGVAIDVDDD